MGLQSRLRSSFEAALLIWGRDKVPPVVAAFRDAHLNSLRCQCFVQIETSVKTTRIYSFDPGCYPSEQFHVRRAYLSSGMSDLVHKRLDLERLFCGR